MPSNNTGGEVALCNPHLAVEVRLGPRVSLGAVHFPGLSELALVLDGTLVILPALHLVQLIELQKRCWVRDTSQRGWEAAEVRRCERADILSENIRFASIKSARRT